jgi:hypothetical protein
MVLSQSPRSRVLHSAASRRECPSQSAGDSRIGHSHTQHVNHTVRAPRWATTGSWEAWSVFAPGPLTAFVRHDRIKLSWVRRLVREILAKAALVGPPLWAREITRGMTVYLVSPPRAQVRPVFLTLRVAAIRLIATTVFPVGQCMPEMSRCNRCHAQHSTTAAVLQPADAVVVPEKRSSNDVLIRYPLVGDWATEPHLDIRLLKSYPLADQISAHQRSRARERLQLPAGRPSPRQAIA